MDLRGEAAGRTRTAQGDPPADSPALPAATPPPRPHTYSVLGSALLASRLHSSSRSLSAAETASPPLPPLPFRR